MIDVPEVTEVRNLLEELGENALITRLDSFVALNEGLESKKGEDFIKVSILGFLEGITTTLRMKYPGDERVARLHERVRARRAELDELFRKPKMSNLGEL
ncbi:DUF3216 domain-containing protein [Thermococcus indicus]|uniref:DUF3216 domain-containing protein n=1 Tax=Thermococcus indicus TaxID=2586643 RepID=A0A4Y5SLD0_9EURY|nr:DUF3216 domain-containing protein [Thermococcus indicus]QDA31727.1 DUF3216 domain-containing protein [Thermococcus indicus]